MKLMIVRFIFYKGSCVDVKKKCLKGIVRYMEMNVLFKIKYLINLV